MNNVTEQIEIMPTGGFAPIKSEPTPRPANFVPPSAGERSIAGYRLLEHIGEGGFGAVWRAEAPGGMLKAVKLVHGRFDERRAMGEMKALEKIKDARHPFLLSLERVEVIDGQLIVVTELADESLKQRYERCVATGAPGIAREDLLRMLAEAADALDYMSKRHGLAHLDIKPENVLLVGDHVKVADFGLVKSVHTQGESLVGGLTPLFAAPETFDGRPSDRSDQYSLAVVYQYALTGKLPFNGKTTAQLAAQHTTARPDLSSLPDCDRPIVERALEKDPFDRFECCRAFVDRLLSIRSAIVFPGVSEGKVAEQFHTEVIEEETDSPTTTGPIREPEQNPIVDLPALELNDNGTHRPTLVVGLGGCGVKTVNALIRRVTEKYGPMESLKWLDAVVIDTDYDEFLGGLTDENESCLAERQFVHLPLKPTQYYRKNAGDLTRWLSRRWIYNIPKSQKPDGIRPLGRLALVDNIPQLEKRLEHAIAGLFHDNVSTEDASSPNRLQPRVFLVGSLTGGTGSAIFSDVAQLVHRALSAYDDIQPEIVCLLAHWTSSSPEAAELAAVNACSALTELHHLQTDGCPGDVTCHLPALGRQHGLFKHVYYVDLGRHAQNASFDSAAGHLAGYLELNLSAELGEFGSAARQSASEQTRGISVARTFAYAALDAGDLTQNSPTINTLIQHALRRIWLHEGDGDTLRAVGNALGSISAEVDINPQRIEKQIHALNRKRANELRERADQMRSRSQMTALSELVDQQFPAHPILKKKGEADGDPMQLAVGELLRVKASALHRSIAMAIDEAVNPVPFAEQLLSQLINQFESAKRRTDVREHGDDLSPPDQSDPLSSFLSQLEQAEADNTHGWLMQFFELLQGSMRGLLRRIQDTKRAIRQRAETLGSSGEIAELTGDEAVVDELTQQWVEWIRTQHQGMGQMLLKQPLDVQENLQYLGNAAREQLLSTRMKDLCDAIEPAALKLGGARRVFTAAPPEVLQSSILKSVVNKLSQTPTLMSLEGSDVLLWCEGEQIKIRDIITSLVGHRPELLELASQLHVRNDVAWARP